MHGHVTLDLEYTPWPTATHALRASVADAFAQAGLPHSRETTAPGVGADEPVGLHSSPMSSGVRNSPLLRRGVDGRLWMLFSGAC
jgi:hypothetical protein